MSRRSEMRRKTKEEKRKNATYNVTKAQLDKMVEEQIYSRLAEYKDEMYREAVRDAFIMMMTIPLHILRVEYWKKSFPQRVHKFTDLVIDMYDDWQEDKISIEDMREELWEYGGVKLTRKDG